MTLRDHAPGPRRLPNGSGKLREIIAERLRGVGPSYRAIKDAQVRACLEERERRRREKEKTP